MWTRALFTVALRGPGKVLLAASTAGWIALVWLLTEERSPHSVTSLAHGMHGVATTSPHVSRLPMHLTAMWLAMILAMAPPLLFREIGRLWRTSLRRLRYPTIGSFVCGYLGVWLLSGVALSPVVGWTTLTSARIIVAVVLVGIWHCSPARQRCLNACHRVRALRAFGAAGQWDALRYGVSTGCYCAAACGVIMLLILLLKNYHLAAMAITAAVTTFERYLPATRPAWQLPLVRKRSSDWPAFGLLNWALKS